MATETEAQAFLDGFGGPALSFLDVGTGYFGTIVSTSVQDARDMESGDVKAWPNGDPMRELVVTLDTSLRAADADDDDGERRWFVKPQAGKALKAALRAARVDLSPGVQVAVVHDSVGKPTRKGLNGPKHFAVKAWAPDAAIDPDEVLAGVKVGDLAGEPF